MKFAAIAVAVMFAASPALAQGYGAADSPSANPSAAQPATPATPSANSSNSSADDTRMASNQSKRHQHKKSSATGTQTQSSNPSNTAQESPDASPQAPAQQ